jgi:hypothetical protein
VLGIATAVLLAQLSACTGAAALSMDAARQRVDAFDLAGAAAASDAAAQTGCVDARLTSLYLRGWLAARDAYRFGGSAASLAPVQQIVDQIDSSAAASSGQAEIVRFVLRAAMAAAQSERDTLALLIEHAVNLERQRRAAGLRGAPLITPDEAAGDLWLQVHRFEDARRAYARAAENGLNTPRVRLGLARVAIRLSDPAAACTEYANLVAGWSAATAPPEIVEARTFIQQPACRPIAPIR